MIVSCDQPRTASTGDIWFKNMSDSNYGPWHKKFFFTRKKTITGKVKAGFLYTRPLRSDWTGFSEPGTIVGHEYADEKDYFLWKLKNPQ